MKSDKVANFLGLCLLGGLVLTGVVGYFPIRELYNSGQKSADAAAKAKQQIAALNQLQSDTQTLCDNYKGVKSQRDAILQLLPVHSEEERLLALLSDLAGSTGVVLSSFSPNGAPPANTGKLTSVTVYPASVNVDGSYAQVQAFLEDVENSARFVDVQSANESSTQTGKTASLGVALGMNAYYQGQTANTGSDDAYNAACQGGN